MKIKIVFLLRLAILCFSLVACSADEPKRPIDYPDSKWVCDIANITFSVSKDCKITDATMVNKNGETIDISLVFTNMNDGKVSITNADGSETYLSGTCSYEEDKLTVMVTDIYNTNLEFSSTRITFERQ